jgi:membrane fusion protein, multidrug efflux system
MNWRTLTAQTAVTLLLTLLVTGCRQQSAPPMAGEPEVAVLTVQPQRVVLTTELPGRTSAYLVAEIRPQVNGLIEKRFFTEGSDVEAGQVLYKIDPRPFQAALDNVAASLEASRKAADRARAAISATDANVRRQEAVLELAQTNRRRYNELFDASAVAAIERDQAATEFQVAEASLRAAQAQVESDQQALAAAEASIKQAQAALELSRINLDYTDIKAPISGRIGKSEVTEGAIVTAYQSLPLATIQELDPIYLDVPQSTMELLRLKRRLEHGLKKSGETANKVKLILEDGTLSPLEGALKFRDVTVDPTTGSVTLRIVVPNPDNDLLPGMFVRAVIEEGVDEQAILIPQQAVTRDPRGNPITLVVDSAGKVAQRSITTDRALGDRWLVSSGLAAGDRVIVEGSQKARPGTPVKAVPFEAGPPPAAEASKSGPEAATHSN